MNILKIEDLHVTVGDGENSKKVLNGVNLTINAGEVHAIMGPNGTGKTTLAMTLMGHPKYKVTQGRIWLEGEELTTLPPEERARKRMFLAFQYPVAVPGVTVASFLRASLKAVRGHEIQAQEFRALIKKEIQSLGIPDAFMTRSLNDGFSGGEKKRLETLQLRLLQPKLAVLDETDSGLDIDALRIVTENINAMRGKNRGFLIITHYQRMLNTLKPDVVHVFDQGKIMTTGGADLALRLEEQGYEWVRTT
jgi:Fe-S cluster assembly ATP-binding protein